MIQIILKSLICKKDVEVDNPENLKVENVVPLVLFVNKDLRKKCILNRPLCKRVIRLICKKLPYQLCSVLVEAIIQASQISNIIPNQGSYVAFVQDLLKYN